MKGLIIRNFAEFVEEIFGDEVTDDMLSLTGLSSGGAFTNVGSYPPDDMIMMVSFLSERTGITIPDLLRTFGRSLFNTLGSAHPELMARFPTCYDMLVGIETVIHRDVRKLYNTNELPRFDVVERKGNERLVLRYTSKRPFADLADGLIHGAVSHYGITETTEIKRTDLSNDSTRADFVLENH